LKDKFVFLFTVVLGVYLLLYFLLQVISVDSVASMLGQNSDVATQQAIERQFRLDLPPWKRLLISLNDLSPLGVYAEDAGSPWYSDEISHSGILLISLRGYGLYIKPPYLGRSFQSQELVTQLLMPRVKITFLLTFISLLFSSILGIFLGVVSALNYGKFVDDSISGLSSIGVSTPSFFIAIILSLVFGYYLSDFTGFSFKGSLIEYDDMGNSFICWRNLVLPVLALSLRPLAIITQLTRNSMLDVLKEDYIRTASAKGLSYSIIVWKHALVNALNPIVSSIAGWFGSLLAGTYFIEIIFDIKGLGYLTVNALMKFDVPVVLGASLYIACMFVLISILLDIIYRYIDPRVRY